MKFEPVKKIALTIWQSLCKYYVAIRTYFNDGSFVVQFFPFLMHPFIRNSYFSFIRLFGILASFCGVYYLFSEAITILFTDVLFSAYSQHTTLELLLSSEIQSNGLANRIHSPLFYVMNTIFSIQGIVFGLIYLFAAGFVVEKKLHLLGMLFAILFSASMLIIANDVGGQYTNAGLQNLGMTIAFACAGFSLLLTGLDIKHKDITWFKHWSIALSIISIIGTISSYLLANEYSPLLERMGIYSIMLWEILLGFAVGKRLEHPGVYIDE